MNILSTDHVLSVGARYGISIDPDDLTHYKLVQVIIMHEEKSPELLEIILQNRAKEYKEDDN